MKTRLACVAMPWVALLLMMIPRHHIRAQLFAEETAEKACPNSFTYENPVCVNNGTLHIGDRVAGEKSCSYCDCQGGWEGVDCGRCSSVSACPDVTINGTVVSATNCSSSSLIPTDEESQLENGKVFSCSCGGGTDSWTESLCGLQPDTWVEFTIKGPGTADSPALMTFTEFAGTETILEEAWPGEHDFYYPVIFEGSATDCTVSRGSCLAVEGTDLGQQECIRYDCLDTQGGCPPEGYPVCDGFPNCENGDGEEYQVHMCIGAPARDKSLAIACQEEQTVNGTYVCWYQQPGEFAPLSMTCAVGSCLYEATTTVGEVETSVAFEAPLDVSQQSIVLVAGALGLVLLFVLFALASDWGSARSGSKSCCISEKLGSGEAFAGDESTGGYGGTGVGLDGGASASTSNPLASTPAVLEWKNLSYSVAVSARGASAGTAGTGSGGGGGGGGGGVLGFLTGGCRSPELSVLSRVSGFAGPADGGTDTNTDTDSAYPVAVVLSGKGKTLSVSSNLSGGPVEEKAVPVAERAAAAAAVVVSGQEQAASNSNSAAAAGSAAAATTTTMPSTVTGILGPSGAGKSSLLDILAGRKRSGEGCATGHVSFTAAGAVRARGPAEIRRVAGYVPQEDVLPGTLSCYEHLMFHARLRMPRSATHAERRERALLVLEELGLLRVADSRVGDARKRGLSGGEKRRLSIAAELVARPPLLFADEPTTGLDAATALRVMTLLKGVASRGTTVVCSLHQPRPRVLNLLDNVMLLSGGRVAYFGRPGDSESYFFSVGRPFPREQPHPADAMLTLCCREDGSALPALFERCPLVEGGVYGGGGGGGGSGATSRQSLRRDSSGSSYQRNLSAGKDLESQAKAVAVARQEEEDDEEEEEEEGDGDGDGWQRWFCCGSGGGGASGGGAKRAPTAGFLVQTEALSRRLLLRAVRHPLLLVLHFGGSVAMAVCLGTVFQGKLDFSFDGAQSRLGVLFFLLLYLSLLSLTSLPVWREDRRLFLSESMGGAYGHLPYFLSVALADVLLVRVVPPLAFAVVAYPLMGLNDFPDGKWTLFWFALILVLVNVSVALAAMGIGALSLPLDLANLVGGAMVLIFSLFSRFLLNGSRIPDAWQWLSDVTPLGYAYESLLVNEFNDPLGSRPYTIDGGQCSPELPVIKPLGSTILQTFEFDPSLDRMHDNVGSLALIALVFGAVSFLLFFILTRTSPLSLRKPDSAKRRTSSRPSSSSFSNNPIFTSPNHDDDNANPQPPVAAVTVTGKSTAEPAATAAVDSEHLPPPPSGPSTTTTTTTTAAATNNGVVAGSDAAGSATAAGPQSGLLLSWEDVWFSVPRPGGRWPFRRRHRRGRGHGPDGHLSTDRLAVLAGVSGFAGPSAVAPKAAGREKGGGSVTAIMGPSGAGKTTLLNVLAGRHRGGGAVAGTVRLNGKAVGAAEVRGVSAYVTQEDVLPENLTCFEHLMFHAHLRMWTVGGGRGGGGRRRVATEDRKNRVLEVLRDLRLYGVRDSRIGGGLSRGISGGEKRRLSIATELLTCPGLLFADEPTTGLDSSTALTTMQLLSSIAYSRGTTIVCSLHQPRPQVYDALDLVLLVSRGKVAFFGPPSSTAAHFASLGRPLGGACAGSADEDAGDGEGAAGVGLADAMLDVVGDAEMAMDGKRKEARDGGLGLPSSSQLVVMPREGLLAEVRRAESSAPPPPSEDELKLLGWTPPVTTQLRALSGRALRDVGRNPYLATLHVVTTPLVGLLVGTLFGDLRRDNSETAGIQGRLGVFFFFLLVLAFLCLTSLASWVRQMALFRHERESGAYGASAHLITSFLADALVCRVAPPILLAATARPLAGLRYGSLLGLCAGLVAFNVGVAAVLAACGAGARSGQEALAMGCLFVVFSALLSGFLVARDDLPTVWGALVWVSPFAHAFEALVINEFSEYGAVFRLSTVISGFTAYSPWLTGDNVLSCFGFDNGRFGADLGLLAAIGAAGLLLAYALLKRA